MNNVSSTDDNTQPLTRAEFLNYLDSEIELASKNVQRPGWTSWALLATLGTLAWVLLSELQKGGYSLPGIGAWIVTLSIVVDLWLWIGAALSGTDADSNNGFFMTKDYFGRNRAVFIPLTAFRIGIILISVQIQFPTDSLIRVGFIIYNLLLALLICIVFILSFTGFPFARNSQQNNKRSLILVVSVIIVNLVFLYFAISDIVTLGGLNLMDVKIASLTVAIAFLSFVYVRLPSASAVLEKLTISRREIALGHLSLQEGMKRVQHVLIGMSPTDILDPHFQQLNSWKDDLSQQLDAAERIFILLKSYRTRSVDQLTRDDEIIARSLELDLRRHISNLSSVLEGGNTSLNRMHRLSVQLRLQTGSPMVPQSQRGSSLSDQKAVVKRVKLFIEEVSNSSILTNKP